MRSCLPLLLTWWLMLFAGGYQAASVDAKEVMPLAIGKRVPEFRLPGIDGREYSLSDFDDAKLLMVIFTCNHCPTAQAYEQRLVELYRDYHSKSVAVVAISPNNAEAVRLDELGYTDVGDSLDEMKIRAADAGFEFPYLYDGETQKASSAFGVLATPHVFIFDESRKLRYAGRIDDNDIGEPKSHDARRALDELLAGEEVSVPETRVFGCSTKWADKKQAADEALKRWNQEKAELQIVQPTELRQRLTEESDKYRLVNVWATWCVPCVEELDELVTIHRMYRKRRQFELITVSADTVDAAEEVKEMLNQKALSAANYLLDTDRRDDLFESVDPEWKGAVPYTILISPEGKVIHRIHGEFDPLQLKRVIVGHIGRTYASR